MRWGLLFLLGLGYLGLGRCGGFGHLWRLFVWGWLGLEVGWSMVSGSAVALRAMEDRQESVVEDRAR